MKKSVTPETSSVSLEIESLTIMDFVYNFNCQAYQPLLTSRMPVSID